MVNLVGISLKILKISVSFIIMNHGSTLIVRKKEEIQMATKGTSHRYGNTKGSNHQGKATEHINYACAKAFDRGGIR